MLRNTIHVSQEFWVGENRIKSLFTFNLLNQNVGIKPSRQLHHHRNKKIIIGNQLVYGVGVVVLVPDCKSRVEQSDDGNDERKLT